MRLEVVLVLREEVVDVVEEVAWRVVEDCVYIGNIFLNGGDLNLFWICGWVVARKLIVFRIVCVLNKLSELFNNGLCCC